MGPGCPGPSLLLRPPALWLNTAGGGAAIPTEAGAKAKAGLGGSDASAREPLTHRVSTRAATNIPKALARKGTNSCSGSHCTPWCCCVMCDRPATRRLPSAFVTVLTAAARSRASLRSAWLHPGDAPSPLQGLNLVPPVLEIRAAFYREPGHSNCPSWEGMGPAVTFAEISGLPPSLDVRADR